MVVGIWVGADAAGGGTGMVAMLGCSDEILGAWLLHGGAGFGAVWTIGAGGIAVLASGEGGAPGVLGLVGGALFWSEGYLVPPWRQSLILAWMVAIETATEWSG